MFSGDLQVAIRTHRETDGQQAFTPSSIPQGPLGATGEGWAIWPPLPARPGDIRLAGSASSSPVAHVGRDGANVGGQLLGVAGSDPLEPRSRDHGTTLPHVREPPRWRGWRTATAGMVVRGDRRRDGVVTR